MAVTATALTTSQGTSATSFNTASISPSSNKLVVLTVGNKFAGVPNTPTATGNSLTWTQIATRRSSSDTSLRITMFRAMGASPSSGAITIDFAGQTQANCEWSATEFGNVKTSGTNGADAVVQEADNDASGTATGITVTLGAFANANNATHGVVITNTSLGITAGSGFTELGNSASNQTIESEWKNSSDTSVDWSWASSSNAVDAMAIEIALSQSGGFFAIL